MIDDRTAIRGALLQLRRRTRLPVAFGGPVTGRDELRLMELVGTVTNSLRGLAVSPGSGLGGKVVRLGRVVALTDYPSASVITHDYDAAVRPEGLRAIVAVPVVVRQSVRGVLYGAVRHATAMGDQVLSAALDTARNLEQDLAVRDELRLRVDTLDAVAGSEVTGPEWEEVRQAHTELRLLAQRTRDTGLRAELYRVCDRLTSATTPARDETVVPRLAPRELDVLSCVAAGCGNAETARRLGLRPETVKSYLRAAMRKLDVHGRYEAVVAARKLGQLP
ncbi:LuxR family GAF modulated transcriptional regulator [Tamaricihabitans halophyticus]|uniref:LuxR family GAF modulated transcriptional regulator n=1 Tax=Tamaricihabitans halophyticus TaxID=1262583 RepID=A0A4R2QVB2_9PSEU|nr:LuxR C-terminal-related transcriptional regulator [Tamaricihabitans halophyticus]TCP53982.1 LuxR family GAF modulated transcriptional regulator [Tamaricihabitans halophyticus]